MAIYLQSYEEWLSWRSAHGWVDRTTVKKSLPSGKPYLVKLISSRLHWLCSIINSSPVTAIAKNGLSHIRTFGLVQMKPTQRNEKCKWRDRWQKRTSAEQWTDGHTWIYMHTQLSATAVRMPINKEQFRIPNYNNKSHSSDIKLINKRGKNK